MKTLIHLHTMRFWSLLTLIICLLVCAPATVSAQKKERTRLKAYYEKLPNNDKKISVILTWGRGKNLKGVQDAQVSIIAEAPDSKIKMATIQTDSLGEAVLIIEEDYVFPVNEEGFSVLRLSYKGNDSFRGSKRKIEFMDLKLDLALEIIDSVKTGKITAFMFDQEGNEVAVEDLKMKVGVKRLYSNLYIDEEVQTDGEGIANFEFPDDIPGDADGTVTVVVRLEDHDEFATVTKVTDVQWGTPVDYSITGNGRSLFGDSAPIWMITAVAVILSGAWLHFLWAVLMVFRIKKLA